MQARRPLTRSQAGPAELMRRNSGRQEARLHTGRRPEFIQSRRRQHRLSQAAYSSLHQRRLVQRINSFGTHPSPPRSLGYGAMPWAADQEPTTRIGGSPATRSPSALNDGAYLGCSGRQIELRGGAAFQCSRTLMAISDCSKPRIQWIGM